MMDANMKYAYAPLALYMNIKSKSNIVLSLFITTHNNLASC